MRLVGNVESIEEKKYTYKILVGNLEWKRTLGISSLEGNIRKRNRARSCGLDSSSSRQE
jgi:hypothetical protein